MKSILSFMFVCFSSLAISGVIQDMKCQEFDESAHLQASVNKLYKNRNSFEIDELKFKFEVVGFDENGRNVEVIDETPVVAVQVGEGWLLGSDRGEWGGALIYRSPEGKDTTLIKDNIEDVYKFPFGYVVTTGLSHMGLNDGSIYVVTNENGEFKAEKLHGLVSAPKTSWILDNGGLLINMWGGVSAIFSTDGSLRRVNCTNIKSR